jgi:hypothetical protein
VLVPRPVELEPPRARTVRFGDVFDASAAGRAHDERHVARGGCAGGGLFAVGVENPYHIDGKSSETDARRSVYDDQLTLYTNRRKRHRILQLLAQDFRGQVRQTINFDQPPRNNGPLPELSQILVCGLACAGVAD